MAHRSDAHGSGSSGGTAAAGDLDLVITRMLDAPRTLVFAAWTEPEHLQHWQGAPEGMTVTVVESDIRTGGRFHLCMHAPDGSDHWLQGVYHEVVAPERLVFTHMWTDATGKAGPETLVTITFAERGAQTVLTLHQTGFVSPQSRDGHRTGWNSSITRFAAYLATV